MQTTFLATQIDIANGQWPGSRNDVVQAFSTSTFMSAQAIENMANVKDIGKAEEDAERKALILEIVTIVLTFLPFLGEFSEFAAPLAQLGRAIALIGAAGNAGLGIFDIVKDPSSAPVEILGILLGGTAFRNPEGFAKLGAARRGMTVDDVAKVGSLFKSDSNSVDSIVKSCAK